MTEQPLVSQQPTPLQPTLPDIVNSLDPAKVEELVGAMVAPFQGAGQKAKREVLVAMSSIILLILAALFVLAIMRITDASNVVFALGTALGYVFGFLSRFLIRD